MRWLLAIYGKRAGKAYYILSRKGGSRLFRDFVYLDTDRIQSIIAQLNEGALTELLESKNSQIQGKLGVAAGILASFLPISVEGSSSRGTSVQSNKILHDYAFNLALKSLDDNNHLLQVEDWDRDELPLPDTAFIVVKGDATILDYHILNAWADNNSITKLFIPASQPTQKRSGSSQSSQDATISMIKQVKQFAEAFMKDMVFATVKHPSGLEFRGPLIPDFFREPISHFIYKRGASLQDEWVMLAQVTQISDTKNKLEAFKDAMGRFNETSSANMSNPSTLGDIISTVVDVLGGVQEVIASVSYPAIAVTPIAVYRELAALR